MKFCISLRLQLIICSLLFGCFSANAQLSDFGVTITQTSETCNGNGTISLAVTNPTAGATMLYSVYLLPNLTVPIAASSLPTFYDGLVAGTYSVVAVQTLDALSSPPLVQQVVIENQIGQQLQYTYSAVASSCNDNEGTVTITTTVGAGVLYEIVTGPVTVTPQASNVFPGLPEGMYKFKVYDACGNSFVTDYNITFDPSPIVISSPNYTSTTSGDCNTVLVTNSISYPEGTEISYPITVQYTIHPSGGAAPIVTTQTFTSGLPNLLEFSDEFPVNNADPYTYDLQITNGCGTPSTMNGIVVNPTPEITIAKMPLPCGQYFISADVSQYTPPYTVSFINAPAGFNPGDYNTTPLGAGPFTDSTVIYGGDGNAVPAGTYQLQVTDACGRTGISNLLTIILDIPIPIVSASNNGCFSDMGKIIIAIPNRKIVFAEIVSAPTAYDFTLPNDVSAYIDGAGKLVLVNMPVGAYTINLTDECGQTYFVVPAVVPAFVQKPFTATALADCNIGIGAVRVVSGNGKLVHLSITQAPATFTGGTLPLDVSSDIDAAGVFFMDNLPEGNYVFHGTDLCGIELDVPATITGYQPSTGISYSFNPHCNSFDIAMSDSDTSSGTPTYWLQMLVPGTTDQWMHPATSVVYVDGTLPNATNSLALPNNQTTYNLQYYGTFRIVKAFQSVGSGTSTKLCFEALSDTFDYQYEVTIDNIFNLACLGTPGDIYIDASGIAPLTYYIIKKDGVDVNIDNGTSNIFSGLVPAVYVFEVKNACGQQKSITSNINSLPDLVQVTTPDNMLICRELTESAFQEFDLASQNSTILGNQSPANYDITYHLSQADADNNLNPLTLPYTNISNPQHIYARVVHNFISLCSKTVSFDIQVALKPQLHVQDEQFICDNLGSVTISADAGYDAYLWSTGEVTQSITVYNPGTYTVDVTKNYTTGLCSSPVEIVVSPSAIPGPIHTTTDDWTDEDNSITVEVQGSGNYEYSIDNIIYQQSPVFAHLEPGVYTVYVRDVGGCGIREKEVALLNYPKFFTPNGDGAHETWRIEHSWFEPGMLLYIYDRFGKLITSFDSHNIGWDGTLNGNPLPSTDYWFVVERQDGRVYRGHFAMIR